MNTDLLKEKQIGSLVKVDLDQIKDNLNSDLINLLQKECRGKVMGYKMTDGQEIGYIIKLSDGSMNWFFENEIKSIQAGYNNDFHEILIKTNYNYSQVMNNNIVNMFNPLIFWKWLTYSLKDVI